jgi:uncharacterized protein YqjF (DUF2071 family)
MAQTWRELLFAHWRVPAETLRPVVPAALPIDTYDGSAWVAVTPFAVRAFRLRFTLPIPVIHCFAEINVRTYVTIDGKPGIYFFSLDAASGFAVESARRVFRLPYFRADMGFDPDGDEVQYRSRRTSADGPPAEFRGRYGPAGEPFLAQPGSLEHFLTERYCLYTLDDAGRIQRGEIHHPPWPLQEAWAEIEENTMGHQVGLELVGEPVLHMSRRQDVVFWALHEANSP